MSDDTMRTPVTRCPGCGHRLDAASHGDGKGKPKPGDFSVCIKCAGLLVFMPGLRLRRAREADVDGLTAEERRSVIQAQQAVRTLARGRRQS